MVIISKLEKTFNAGTPNEVKALRGIDLHIQEGEFVTVIGTNGSGKSTMLNAVAGTFRPDVGTIRVAGHDVTTLPAHRRAKWIARVFQNPFQGTAPEMSIAENLHMATLRTRPRFPRLTLGTRTRQRLSQRVKALEMQLEGRLDTVIGMLSGGQRQALTLLMSVLTRPRVLLLDEHTAALDPKSAQQVIRLTRQFVQEGNLTALMVTHSMQQALDVGTRTIMMNQGQIIDDISAEEKRHLTVDDLLDKFAELRKSERLTEEMLQQLRMEYL